MGAVASKLAERVYKTTPVPATCAHRACTARALRPILPHNPCFPGVPDAQHGGRIKIGYFTPEDLGVWAKRLHNPSHLGTPQCGDKIRSGYATLAVLKAQMCAKRLHNHFSRPTRNPPQNTSRPTPKYLQTNCLGDSQNWGGGGCKWLRNLCRLGIPIARRVQSGRIALPKHRNVGGFHFCWGVGCMHFFFGRVYLFFGRRPHKKRA